jgi:hypothetical protein
LLWSLLIGQLLREYAFHAVEALVRSTARRALGVSTSFGDDALAYFTERLSPAPTRAALAATLRRAKRNKAFDPSRFIGLAVDGTTVGRCRAAGCPLCRPFRNATGEVVGYLFPSTSNPTDLVIVNTPPVNACCGARGVTWAGVLPTTWSSTGSSPPRLFFMPSAMQACRRSRA